MFALFFALVSSKEGICQSCIELTEKVQKLIKDNQEIDKIKNKLTKFCKFLPPMKANLCADFIEQKFDAIAEMVSQSPDVNPSSICTVVNLCKKRRISLKNHNDYKILAHE